MLSHLYGADSYRRQRYLREQLLNKYQAKYPNGVARSFDLEDEGAFERLKAFSGSVGLFAAVSLAVAYHPDAGEKEFVQFLKNIEGSEAVSIIVVSDKKLTKEFSFLYNGKEREFAELTGAEFLKFIKAESKGRGFDIPDIQLKAIGAIYDGDTWGAMTEIERVIHGGEIADAPGGFDFVAAMSSLSSSDARSRLRSLFLLLDGDDAAKVFNMAGGWARGANKLKIADYDVHIKSGRLEFGDALFDYVL